MSIDENKHIFLVDDDLKFCKALSETLEQIDVKVSYFTNPEQCLERLDSNPCDLLITDFKMPGINGIEIMNRIKRLRPWLPVLIISGYGNIPLAVEAMKEGAVDFLEKPLDTKSFLKQIQLLLSDKELENSHRMDDLLTKSEHEVLKLVVEGKSSNEIGFLTHRSSRTIEFHRTNIMKKLGVTNVVDMINQAIYLKLIEIPKRNYQNEAEDNIVKKNKDP